MFVKLKWVHPEKDQVETGLGSQYKKSLLFSIQWRNNEMT
jgi:hypothetical protein